MMMPYYRTDEAVSIAKQFEINFERKWLIKQTPRHDWFRSVLVFTIQIGLPVLTNEITIRELTGKYSKAFEKLLEEYYLKL